MNNRLRELGERIAGREDDIAGEAYWWLDCIQRDLSAQGYRRNGVHEKHRVHGPFDAVRDAISDANQKAIEDDRPFLL